MQIPNFAAPIVRALGFVDQLLDIAYHGISAAVEFSLFFIRFKDAVPAVSSLFQGF